MCVCFLVRVYQLLEYLCPDPHMAQVNSVQFSNHTGYPLWRGRALDGPGLWELVEGLQSNGLLCYTHLLTGAPAVSSSH